MQSPCDTARRASQDESQLVLLNRLACSLSETHKGPTRAEHARLLSDSIRPRKMGRRRLALDPAHCIFAFPITTECFSAAFLTSSYTASCLAIATGGTICPGGQNCHLSSVPLGNCPTFVRNWSSL